MDENKDKHYPGPLREEPELLPEQKFSDKDYLDMSMAERKRVRAQFASTPECYPLFLKLLYKHKGIVSRAARELGVTPAAVYQAAKRDMFLQEGIKDVKERVKEDIEAVSIEQALTPSPQTFQERLANLKKAETGSYVEKTEKDVKVEITITDEQKKMIDNALSEIVEVDFRETKALPEPEEREDDG